MTQFTVFFFKCIFSDTYSLINIIESWYSFNKCQKIKLSYTSPIKLAPPFTKTHTFHASLMEEYPQRDIIMSELGTRVLQGASMQFVYIKCYNTINIRFLHDWKVIVHVYRMMFENWGQLNSLDFSSVLQ